MDCNTLRGNLIFAAYIVIATLYLGIQMFQGLSPIDIGVYMSGYQHFNEEPYTLYYLGQWLMTYSFSGWLCDVLSINSFLGLRVLHLVYVMFLQTVVYLYLRRYIPCKYIVVGLSLATLAHFGSYTEINYNDYSSGLLTLAVLAYHKGLSGCKAALLAVGGDFGHSLLFQDSQYHVCNSAVLVMGAVLQVCHGGQRKTSVCMVLRWICGRTGGNVRHNGGQWYVWSVHAYARRHRVNRWKRR